MIQNDIRELYDMGSSPEDIAIHLSCGLNTVRYYIWQLSNSPPKPYISDKAKREMEIEKLKSLRGKTYKQIIYLKYLTGATSKEVYESAFI